MNKMVPVNVNNRDQQCFVWGVVSEMTNTSRTSQYPYFSTALNLKGMNFLVTLKDISHINFVKMNNFSMNFCGLESEFKDKKYIRNWSNTIYREKIASPY